MVSTNYCQNNTTFFTFPCHLFAEPEIKQPQNDCVYTDKKGNVNIRVLAKPGAKTNQITGKIISFRCLILPRFRVKHSYFVSGLTEEGVGVQINAPPVDGEANSALIKFISKILDVRKSDIGLEKVIGRMFCFSPFLFSFHVLFFQKGAKSRQKTLQLGPGVISVDDAKKKLKGASDK